jgi:purine-binding chemotaxis protein CheW
LADLQMLVFDLDGQRYGFPLGSVREVLRAVAISPLPSAPDIVEGVLNLRGRPVPVLDFRRRLGVSPRELNPSEHFVIAEIAGRVVAFRVDRADCVAQVAASAVATADALGPGVRHIEKIASDEAGVVFIYDPAAFLSAAESSALTDALSGGAP